MSQRKNFFRHFLVFLEGVMFHACWADQQLQRFGHRCHSVDQVFPLSDVRLCKKTALPPTVVPVCPPCETDNDWSVPFFFFPKPMNSAQWHVVYTFICDLKIIFQYILHNVMAIFTLCFLDSKQNQVLSAALNALSGQLCLLPDLVFFHMWPHGL